MIHNPSNLYSAGTVVLNSQPEASFYAQMMAKQQAKKDALEQYYTKQLGDVTDAGMRNKDVLGGWGQKLNDWQTKYMNPEKRKYLANPRLDNYRTVTDFNREHQELLQDAVKSKQEAADEAKIWELQKAGKLSLTDTDMDIMHRKGLTIYDPKRKDATGNEPDLLNLSFTHQWNPADETKLYKGIFDDKDKTQTPDESRQTFDANKMTVSTPIVHSFSKDKIAIGAKQYAMIAPPEAKTHYFDLSKDPAYFSAMNSAYQNVYGATDANGQPNVVDNPEKATEAAAILHAMNDKGETIDTKPNRQAVMNKAADIAKEKAKQQDAYVMKHIGYAYGLREQAGQNLQQIVSNAYENDKNYAATHNGEVETNPEKIKLLFGSGSGTIKMNNNGGYELWGKDADGKPKMKASQSGQDAQNTMMKYNAPAVKPGVTATHHKVVIKKGELD